MNAWYLLPAVVAMLCAWSLWRDYLGLKRRYEIDAAKRRHPSGKERP